MSYTVKLAILPPGQPVYRAPPPAYVEEVCHVERRGFIDPYGVEHIRRIRVCK